MTIMNRVTEVLGLVTKDEVASLNKRAYESGFSDGNDETPSGSSGLRSYGYRTMTVRGRRDADFSFDKMVEAAWDIWQSNPLAARALEIKRDYILGKGFQVKSNDLKLQGILDAFWKANRMQSQLRQYVLQVYLFGMQILPVFVQKSSGAVTLGYIDPAEVEDIITHPEDSTKIMAIILKDMENLHPWETGSGRRIFRVVQVAKAGEYQDKMVLWEQDTLEDWETEMLEHYGLEAYTGDTFYIKVNSVSNVPFGFSDLLQTMDWLDSLDGVLFNLAERENMAGYFLFDVAVGNSTPAEVETRAQQLKNEPPGKGTVRVHNDSETWQLLAPELAQTSSIATVDALVTFILGGMGYPRHWYGYGDQTNRATAAAQGDPTWKSLEHDQATIHDFVSGLITLAVNQAEIAGLYTPERQESASGEETDLFQIILPEMTTKDIAQIAGALSNMGNVLAMGVQSGWMTEEDAKKAWAKLLNELNIKLEDSANGEGVPGSVIWLQMHGVVEPLSPSSDQEANPVESLYGEGVFDSPPALQVANAAMEGVFQQVKK